LRTIYLIRHGETDWNKAGRLQGREDIPLNDAGIEQANSIGKLFIDTGISRIISSPLSRAYYTAEIIGQIIGITCINRHGNFVERDYGAASGLLPEERKKLFSSCAPNDQESISDLRTRVVNAFIEITQQFSDLKMIIVSHGAAINSIIAFMTDEQFGTGKTRLENCSISKLIHVDSKWSTEFINLTPDDILSHGHVT
jgi:uncharacterized phosphatase